MAKAVTVSSIAAMTGVSKATVSRVLNNSPLVREEVRQVVMAAVKRTGYIHHKKGTVPIPTAAAATAPTSAAAKAAVGAIAGATPIPVIGAIEQIGLSVPSAQELKHVYILSDELNPFVEGSYLFTFLQAIQAEAERLGITCEFIGKDKMDSKESLIEALSQRQLCHTPTGAIVLGMDNLMLVEAVQELQIPLMVANANDPHMTVNSTAPDSEFGMFSMAEYLIDRGHTKACILTAHIKHAMYQRTDGFMRAFKMRHIPFDESKQVIDLCQIAPLADPSGKLYRDLVARRAGMDFGAEKMVGYLIEHGYFDGMTAIACICDATAISLIKGLQQYGIEVPKDISVTGFDDIVLSSMISPPLTTVHLGFNQQAKTAFAMLALSLTGVLNKPLRVQTSVSIKERLSVRTLL